MTELLNNPPVTRRPSFWGVPVAHLMILALILAASTASRVYRLDVPSGFYFDEVYFGYTAEQYARGNPDAYDFGAHPPEGFSNEWTHPPLGKLIIAAAVKLGVDANELDRRQFFREHPTALTDANEAPEVLRRSEEAQKAIDAHVMFVERLPGVLAGVLAALLVFILTLKLTGSSVAGLLACFLYCIEGLAFVQSRIATADLFLTVFILASVICYVTWRLDANRSRLWLLGAGLFAGLTLATKWTGFFLIALLGGELLLAWLIEMKRYEILVVLIAVGLAAAGTEFAKAAWLIVPEHFRSEMSVEQVKNVTHIVQACGAGLAAVATFVFWLLIRRRHGQTLLWLTAALATGIFLEFEWRKLFIILVGGVIPVVAWHKLRTRQWTVLWAGVALLLLPAGVYVASYAQYFAMGFTWSDFLAVHDQMWWYHTNLSAPHDYASKPWQWVLNLRPVWFYVDYSPKMDPGSFWFQFLSRFGWEKDQIANIYNLGNSVVLYVGFLSVIYLAVTGALKRRWAAGFLVCAYLILWAPWVASPRVMFFYHYLQAAAFLCVAGGWALWRLGEVKPGGIWIGPGIVALVLLLAMAWFVIFYPNMTALPVPRDWADKVYGFIKSWR